MRNTKGFLLVVFTALVVASTAQAGTVVGWGSNTNGQAIPPSGNDYIAIAAGGYHSLALKSDGTVVGWGSNTNGQAIPPSGNNYIAIAAGTYHSLALKSDGTVVGWGSNTNGQISIPQGLTGVAIAADGSNSMALASDGAIVAWGNSSNGHNNPPPGHDYIAISCGGSHSLALRGPLHISISSPTEGHLYFSNQPIPVDFTVTDEVDPEPTATVTLDGNEISGSEIDPLNPALALGQHTLRVTARDNAGNTCTEPVTFTLANADTTAPNIVIESPLEGHAYSDTDGPLSVQYTVTDDENPQPVVTVTFDGNPFSSSQIDLPGLLSGNHTFRISAQNLAGLTATTSVTFMLSRSIFGWGRNSYGAVVPPPGLKSVIAITAGSLHNLALKSNGTVIGWGYNASNMATPPSGLQDVVAISAGGYHSLALKSDGTVVGWGDNDYGQRTIPQGLRAIAISAGRSHTLALKSDGTVVGWGYNNYGQSAPPSGLMSVAAISAGGYHSLALKSDGAVVGWGSNASGQSAPPSGLTNVVAISAGQYHSLALKSDGAVVGWGSNASGQSAPPSGLTNVVAVAAGHDHSLALKSDGAVVGWGGNDYGQAIPPPGLTEVAAISAGSSYSLALRSPVHVSISSPLNNHVYFNDAPIPVNFTVTDSFDPQPTVTVTLDGAAFSGSEIDPSNPVLAIGTHTLRVTAEDSGENAAVQSVTFTLANPDTTPPNIVIASPLDGHTYLDTDAPISVQYSVTDEENPQPIVTVTLDGAPFTGSQITSSSGLLGNHTFLITAQNAAGLTASQSVAFAVHRQLPQADDYGSIVGWGLNTNGQANSPAGSDYIGISGGSTHSLAVKADGTLVGWGYNGYGQATPPSGNYFIAVAAGSSHSLALTTDETVVGWGRNTYGQSAPPSGLTGVIAIAAGGNHSIALKSDGTVVCWGYNNYGQSAPPSGLSNVIAIAAGGNHSMALTYDHRVVSWGLNASGQCDTPSELDNVEVVAIAAGSMYSVALKSDGTVVGWGLNTSGQSTPPSGLTSVAAIAAGSSHCLALKSDGTVVGWGSTSYGKTTPPSGNNYIAIAAGGNHSLAITTPIRITVQSPVDGGSYCDGPIPVQFTVTDDLDPQPVVTLTLNDQPFTGSEINTQYYGYHTLRLTASDSFGRTASRSVTFMMLWCPPPPSVWISSPKSRVYFDTEESVAVECAAFDWQGYPLTPTLTLDGRPFYSSSIDLSDLTYGQHTLQATAQMYGTTTHSVSFTVCALQQNDAIVGWGFDDHGQATPPPGLTDAVAISAGTYHSLGIRPDGVVVGWGNNVDGQATPPPGLAGITAVSAGAWHSLALRSDGTVVCWGYNNYGQTAPPQGLSDVIAVSAGWYHSLALKTDGTVVGWGRNTEGQAAPPQGLASIVAISAGSNYSLALRVDGTVVGWGRNTEGQATPPQGLASIVAISAGSNYSLALRADGTVVGWGDNYHGRATPPQGLTGVVAISAGGAHSLAAKSDGSVVGWGDEYYGPSVPEGLSKVVAIEAGSGHSLALRDIAPPSIAIQSPEAGKAYCITGKPVPVLCAVTDDFDQQPTTTMTLDSQSFSGAEIAISDFALGDHILEVTASDRFGNTATRTATFTIIAAPTVADAKLGVDGLPADITEAIVSAAFTDFFYIESDGRTCGIRVNRAGHSLQAGMRADVTGVLRTNSNAERCIDASDAHRSDPPNDSGSVRPLALPNCSLGGGPFEAQSGVWGWVTTIDGGQIVRAWGPVTGLNNIGLLVTTWGKFIKTGDTTFTLDDGSGTAVDCVAPSDTAWNSSWKYAVVSGISSCEMVGTEVHRLLRVSSGDDIAGL